MNEARDWALCGDEFIQALDEENYGVIPTDLSLVLFLTNN